MNSTVNILENRIRFLPQGRYSVYIFIFFMVISFNNPFINPVLSILICSILISIIITLEKPIHGLLLFFFILPFWYCLRRIMYVYTIDLSRQEWLISSILPNLIIGALIFIIIHNLKSSKWKIFIDKIDVLVLFFTIIYLLQIFNPNTSFLDGIGVFHKVAMPIFLYPVGRCFVKNYSDLPVRFIKLIIISGIFVSLYALYQYWFGLSSFEINSLYDKNNTLGGDPTGYIIMSDGTVRTFSTFSGPAEMGSFLVLALVCSLYVLREKMNRELIDIFAFILILVAIILSMNRTTYIMAILSPVLIWGFYKGKFLKASLLVIISGYLLILSAGTLANHFESELINRLLFIQNFSGFLYDKDSTIVGRTELWLSFFQDGRYSLLGKGAGAVMGNFKDSTLITWLHNDYLTILEEVGPLGLGLLFYIFGSIMLKSYIICKKNTFANKELTWLPWLSSVLILIFVFRGFMGGFWGDYVICSYFWLLLGIIKEKTSIDYHVIKFQGRQLQTL